jgi:hypothetical protein
MVMSNLAKRLWVSGFLCVAMATQGYCTDNEIGIAWRANLHVLPGMANKLPSGVVDGQMVSGYFTTKWQCVSRSNDWMVANYLAESTQLTLGSHLYQRHRDDGQTPDFGALVDVMDDDPTYHDRIALSHDLVPGGTESTYIFSLVLTDNDNQALVRHVNPTCFDFGLFESGYVNIYHLQGGVNDGRVAHMELSELQLSQIPEPATVALIGLGGMAVRRVKSEKRKMSSEGNR